MTYIIIYNCFKHFKDLDVRLSKSSQSHSGSVEVNNNGVWSPICSNGFGNEEAGVVCRMLGYHTG